MPSTLPRILPPWSSSATALPMSRNPCVTVQKGRYQIGLVTVDVGQFFLAGEIAKHGFGRFGIGIGGEAPAEHGRGDGQVEQSQPAPHLAEGLVNIAFTLLQGNCFQPKRDGNLPVNGTL